MKKLLVAGIAAAALCGAPALAADIPTKAPAFVGNAPLTAPMFNWTGFYAGINAGYGWKDPTVSYNSPNGVAIAGPLAGAPPASFNWSGALGGVQAGYNWQVRPHWLVGIEADIDASGIRGEGSSHEINLGTIQVSERVSWFGTVRGRLGWLPTDNVLIYGTGGFAYGQLKTNVVLNNTGGLESGASNSGIGWNCTPNPLNCFVGSSSSIRTGWTAGAGFETLVLNNMTFKLEYLYVNLGSQDVNVVAANSNGQPTAASFTAHYSDAAFNVVRAGLNWKF